MQLLAAKFNQIATAIETTNAQIAALQAKLSELQEHQQQLQSVEQACQSALSQVDTALMMLHHVDPSQVDTFKDALVVKFATDAIGILEPATTTPAELIEPEPSTNSTGIISYARYRASYRCRGGSHHRHTRHRRADRASAQNSSSGHRGTAQQNVNPEHPQVSSGQRSRRERDAGKHRSEVKDDRHRVRYLGRHRLTQSYN